MSTTTGGSIAVDSSGVAVAFSHYWVWEPATTAPRRAAASEPALQVYPSLSRLASAAVITALLAALALYTALSEVIPPLTAPTHPGLDADAVGMSLLALLALRFAIPAVTRAIGSDVDRCRRCG